ncbi:MAG: TolA-binding protein [Sulfurimonas sp.]|jgi:TolA-binding protein|uniref:tetratricopeptide repeat protein n=1 Tax=Sulfurimonas sp. TaxID=2022749 RepID=UPI0039E4E808
MLKSLLATLCVASISLLVAAEPSAFGAGNLDSPNPYGLTSSEQNVLKNKHALKKVVLKSNNQANEVDSIRERIDGLQSIVESLSRKSQYNKRSLGLLEEKATKDLLNADEYEKRLGQSVELNSQLSEKNAQAIAKNLLLAQELSKLIDTINTTYVTKIEFNELVNSVNEFKSLVAKEFKSKTKLKTSSLDKMTNGEVADQAEAFYNKQYYTKGIEYYSHLITKNYKPANSHFMIGQMKFKRKNYSEAISYYKKSTSLYSKASYMPELLLHTAISMEKTNDKKNAKVFYNAILVKYPNSTEAKRAKENLLAL